MRFFVIFSVLLLTSCGSAKVLEQAGLISTEPDEFSVLTNPDLEVPPDFELPEPQPQGDFRSNISNEARESLTGKRNIKTNVSRGDIKLLQKAGAEKDFRKSNKNIAVKKKTDLLEKNRVTPSIFSKPDLDSIPE